LKFWQQQFLVARKSGAVITEQRQQQHGCDGNYIATALNVSLPKQGAC
jgi:hypothetical protein